MALYFPLSSCAMAIHNLFSAETKPEIQKKPQLILATNTEDTPVSFGKRNFVSLRGFSKCAINCDKLRLADNKEPENDNEAKSGLENQLLPCGAGETRCHMHHLLMTIVNNSCSQYVSAGCRFRHHILKAENKILLLLLETWLKNSRQQFDFSSGDVAGKMKRCIEVRLIQKRLSHW